MLTPPPSGVRGAPSTPLRASRGWMAGGACVGEANARFFKSEAVIERVQCKPSMQMQGMCCVCACD